MGNQIMDVFDEYDEDGSGEIEIDEMRDIMSKKSKEMQDKIKKKQMEAETRNQYWNFCCFKIKKNNNDSKEENAEEIKEDISEKQEEETDNKQNGIDLNGGGLTTIAESADQNEESADKNDFYAVDEFAENEPFEYGLLVEIHGCDNLKTEQTDLEDSLKTFVKSIVGFMLWLTIAATIFSIVEGANFGDMLWFCIVTSCTVG